MLVQTQAFMDAFKAPTRALHFRLTINNVIYTKDRIKSVDVNFGNIVDENFSVGTTYSNSLKVVFSEVITTFNEMDNVKAEIGIPVPDPEDAEKTIIEYSSLGHFLISERVDINRNDKITSLFCLDKMILMEQEYVSQLTYPAGIDQVALEIANLSGAVIDQTSFERIGTTGINKMVGYTYREAIGLIAQLEAGFATFDRQGKLAIRQLNDTTFTITPNEYFLKGLTKNDLQYRLGGISVKVDENTTLQAGSATGSQIVLENSVMTQILLDGLWQQLSALNFYPFTLDWRGNPVVEIGDWVTLTDIDGNLFKAPVLGYSLTYNGGLTAKMSGDVETMPANTVQYTPPLQQTVKRLTNAIVKANGNVNYYDIDTPANPKVGDLWFKPNGPNTDLYMYYEKNGILGWHLEVSDTQSNVLSDKVETAKEIAEAAKSRADDVWAEVDLAVANAGSDFSSFQTTYNQKATGWDSTTTYVTNNTTKLNSLISNADGLISTVQTIGVNGTNISQMVMTDSNFGVKVRENVSVGGRNYFQPDKVGSYLEYNAINGVTQDGFSTQYWGGVLTASIAGFIPKDAEYTISGYVKVNGAIKAQSIFSSAINTYGWDFKTAVYNTTTGYFKFTQKYVSSSHWIIHAPMQNVVSGDLITFEKVMFELGNTDGDYVPAIESQVAKGEVYSQMMIDAEGILFDTTGNLVLSAEHVIFDTVNPVVIPSAAIPNLSADKITTGTLNAANVNVVNVNANNITGKNASLIRASFNDINSSVQVDGTGLTTVDVTGLYAKYASGAITFGGGGEVVRMKNNTGNNPNRSGVALEPINSAMSNIDLDLYTRGIASLNIGKSDYDDGYRLRISSELANTNNYYFSLKSGTSFSFNFDARNYTDSRNSMQILQHNSAHHSIGKNQNWGSQLHFVNDDLIVAKGGTDNRTNLFAGGLYGRGVYYQYGTLTYDIAGTIADILSWIGSGVTWRMKS